MKEEIQYLENKIKSNNLDSEQLKKKGNNDLSGILDDETEILESILKKLNPPKSHNIGKSIEVMVLNEVEVQSRRDRIYWAESLILQLDAYNEGRNSWLLNYGRGELGEHLRDRRNIEWDEVTQSAKVWK